MGKPQGLSQGLLKGLKTIGPGQGRSQTQGHRHWGHLGAHQGQIRHLRVPDRNQSQGHSHRGLLGGYQGQVLQGQQGQVLQEGGSHMGEQLGLSQGLPKGSKAIEPGQGKNQTQGHCHWGHLGGHQGQIRHLRAPDRNQSQGHSHWGLLGELQGQVHQGQQGQVFQEGGSHMGKQQGLSQGLLQGSKAIEPEQGRTQTQGHCHWGPLGGHQGQTRQLRVPDRNQIQGHRH